MRGAMKRMPSSKRPKSPVRIQRPGRTVSALASSLCQYPSIDIQLRASMLPSAPAGTSVPSSSVMRACDVGMSGPTQSGAAFSIQPGAQLMSPVSVEP